MAYALCVLQDRAMPLAEQNSGLGTRLRLCNKLTELMLDLKMFGEAVEFAHVALDISITLGTLMIHFSGFAFHLALQASAVHLKEVLLMKPSYINLNKEVNFYMQVKNPFF